MFRTSLLAGRICACATIVTVVTALLPGAENTTSAPQPVPANIAAALRAIQASNLRGDLSFLASDALAGRYTPSPGLDVAAEFIASQFRAAGLQPGGDHDYFQVASMVDRVMPKAQSPLTLQEGAATVTVPAASLAITSSSAAASIEDVQVIAVRERSPEALKDLDLSGKVVLAPSTGGVAIPAGQRATAAARNRAFNAAIQNSQASALVLVGPLRQRASGSLLTAEQASEHRVPIVLADSKDLEQWIQRSGPSSKATVTVQLPSPDDHSVELKNVIAILPGSDVKLKDTCVMVTAHYDHIGTLETGRNLAMPQHGSSNDRIFNGANDDGSGTVSVIEIARALAQLRPRPKRSVVFMTFFGEERGDIGSSYYGKHPVFPISKTVADLNLEQVGRTDSTDGKQVNTASLTGYDYSDVTKYMERAGRLTGVKVYLNKTASDDYFVRSDNAALAEQGVPAHSLTVAFDYPDYHGLGDEWTKVDYDNMARVDRMIALGLINIANNPVPPKWNAANPKTASFREAQAKQQQ